MGHLAADCWYRNQDWLLVEQLEMGVRWLDLAFCEFEGEYRACHQGYGVAGEKTDALYNHLVDEIAQQVATFLDNNPNEVILIWLKNEGNPTETDRHNIWNRFNNPTNGLSKYIFSATCKVGDCYTDTLQTMIDANKRVLFTGWANPDVITGYPSNDWVFDTYNSNGQEWTATRDHYGTTWDLNYQISQAFSQTPPLIQPVKFQALFGRPTLCWRDLSNNAYEISSSLFATHQNNAMIPFVTYLADYVTPGHTMFAQTRSADAFRKNVAGTWIQSCTNASYKDGILNATCIHNNDTTTQFQKSSLKSISCAPNSITNSNGLLSCTCLIGGPSNQTGGCGLQGSWTESCTGVSSYSGDVLTAVCKQSDGVRDTSSSLDTSKCIQEIRNSNGMLDC
ncbi:hypothetical protein HDU80_010265 [Chytriomyces hyalinus]|nr:hypothetical protein HDU80_010265 [Chytriomyces hyalinus]